MRYLFANRAAALRPLEGRGVLLAFDFDGTLAPIVARREAAAMRPRTAALFHEVCARYPTAVITGRARGDVLPRLAGAAVVAVVGNHGLETGAALPPARARLLETTRARLRELPRVVGGLDVEDKGASFSVHLRRARRPRVAAAAVLAALPAGMKVVPGKAVLNVVLATAPHKGDALAALARRHRARALLYVGDDVTDEDAFALDAPGLVGVRVGRARRSAAEYFLRAQPEVDRLLRWLVTHRPPRP
jgi:trehalose 6-phosphate phosphatase